MEEKYTLLPWFLEHWVAVTNVGKVTLIKVRLQTCLPLSVHGVSEIGESS